MSGQYCDPPPLPVATEDNTDEREQRGIRANMFKALVGQGHREFSSNRQQVITGHFCCTQFNKKLLIAQDAQEFFLHLLSLIDRAQVSMCSVFDSMVHHSLSVTYLALTIWQKYFATRSVHISHGVVKLFICVHQVEECVRCVVSGKVRYSHKPDFLLTLPVPIDKATNRGDQASFIIIC